MIVHYLRQPLYLSAHDRRRIPFPATSEERICPLNLRGNLRHLRAGRKACCQALALCLVTFAGLLTAFADETAAPTAADHSRQMARGLELFKSQVGPLLNENCVKCHGGEKTKGELDLTTREGLLKGGAEGPDVIAGKSKES